MKLLDSQYMETPFYGYRRLKALLKVKGYDVSANRLRRLMNMVCWRSVKQEYVYKNSCDTCKELWSGMTAYFDFYNNLRLHQSLDYQCPATVYMEKRRECILRTKVFFLLKLKMYKNKI